MKYSKLALLTIACAILPLAAKAVTVISTYPNGGNTTYGWQQVAQTFTTPLDNTLDSYQFSIAGRESDGQVTFSIYDWSGTSPVGAALFSTTADWTNAGGDISITGINLSLVSGNLYGAVVDLQGYGGSSLHFGNDGYAGGNGLWAYQNGSWNDFSYLDTEFKATFNGGSVPDSGATIALLGVSFLGLAALRRRFVA